MIGILWYYINAYLCADKMLQFRNKEGEQKCIFIMTGRF